MARIWGVCVYMVKQAKQFEDLRVVDRFVRRRTMGCENMGCIQLLVIDYPTFASTVRSTWNLHSNGKIAAKDRAERMAEVSSRYMQTSAVI